MTAQDEYTPIKCYVSKKPNPPRKNRTVFLGEHKVTDDFRVFYWIKKILLVHFSFKPSTTAMSCINTILISTGYILIFQLTFLRLTACKIFLM